MRLAEPVVAAELQFAVDSSDASSLTHLVVQFAAGLLGFFLLQRYDLGRAAIKYGFGLSLTFLAGAGLLQTPVAYAPGVVMVAVLWAHPEWYVIDAVGATLAAVLGVSYGPLPALLALVAWAGYDACTVYRSDAMETLAAAGLVLSIPGGFFLHDRLDASLVGRDVLGETDQPGEFKLLGVGDAMVPGFPVVSADWFLDAPAAVAGLSVPTLGAVAGSLVGIELLVRRIEGAHAGLPVLNTATIAGSLVGALAAGLGL